MVTGSLILLGYMAVSNYNDLKGATTHFEPTKSDGSLRTRFGRCRINTYHLIFDFLRNIVRPER